MSDFFSSALSYFGGGSDSGGGSRFVGQTVDLGEGNKLKVKKVIAEGRFKGIVSEGDSGQCGVFRTQVFVPFSGDIQLKTGYCRGNR